MKKYWISILVVFTSLVGLFLIRKLTQGYFQQDEWYAFGKLQLTQSELLIKTIAEYFAFDAGHYVPLHRSFFLLFYKVFSMDYSAWIIMSLIWHGLNTYLVSKVVRELTGNREISYVTALLFAFSAATSQATTWVGANINTHGATTFALISVLYYWRSTSESVVLSRNRVMSIFALIVSLMFKEIAVGLFLVYILYHYCAPLKNRLQKSIPYFTIAIFYLLLRFLMIISAQSETHIATASQSIGEITYNIASFPAKMFTQSLVPQRLFLDIGKYVGELIPSFLRPETGTSAFDLFVQSTVVEVISFVVFLLFCTIVYKRRSSTYLVFVFLFTVMNSFIFALSPERVGIVAVMDSRNMYLIAMGSLLLLVATVYEVISRKSIQILFIGVLMGINILYLNMEITKLASDGYNRRSIITSIISKINNQSKVIIYTQSDTPYYGLPDSEPIMPFQSGFGHTMLVVYANDNYVPPKFFEDRFLWDITSVGYQEFENVGFGYFRSFPDLQEAYNTFSIDKENIYAFRWEGEIEGLTDISVEVRDQLE